MTHPPIAGRFIAPYLLSDGRHIRDWARLIAEHLSAERVVLPKNRIEIQDRSRDVVQARDVGPREFLRTLAGAEAIVTDSFHGTIFSVLFQKPFFSFHRYADSVAAASTSRLQDFLAQVGLSERLASKESPDALYHKLDIDFPGSVVAVAVWRKTRCMSWRRR